MATFKNRALTLATAGILSGTAITIATDGLIQVAEAVPSIPTPSVVVSPAGGYGPGITELRVALVGDYREFFNFTFFDRSAADFTAAPLVAPVDTGFVDNLTPVLFLRDQVSFSPAYWGKVADVFILEDTSHTQKSAPFRFSQPDNFVFTAGDAYSFVTPNVTAFADLVAARLADDSDSGFIIAPIEQFTFRVVNLFEYASSVPFRVGIFDSSDYRRINLFEVALLDEVALHVDSIEGFRTQLGSIYSAEDNARLTLLDESDTFFDKGFVKVSSDIDRILILFAHAFFEDDDG